MSGCSKTWDDFIARQVRAQLAGEFTLSTCYPGMKNYQDRHLMAGNGRVRGPKDGMVWCYGFGRMPSNTSYAYWSCVTEFWYVNLTKRQVLLVRRT